MSENWISLITWGVLLALLQVLAALPWEGGRKTEAVARHAHLSEDIARRALEDLLRRGMVTIDESVRQLLLAGKLTREVAEQNVREKAVLYR